MFIQYLSNIINSSNQTIAQQIIKWDQKVQSNIKTYSNQQTPMVPFVMNSVDSYERLCTLDSKRKIIINRCMQKDNNGDSNQSLPTLKVRKSSTATQCDICLEQYHILGKWPMIACPNLHYFCDHCIKRMLGLNNQQPTPCPICRALIKKSLIQPHVKLFRIINSQNTVKNALKQQSNQLFLYAFQYQIFQIASLFKENKLEDLDKIQKLNLSDRKINKIQHLSYLKSLSALHLQNNILESISELQNFKNLKILNLSHNFLVKIDKLGSLPKLENLSAQFNQIKQIDLMNFSQLRHFFIFGNPLESILVDMFLMVDFPKLVNLSFSIQDHSKEILHRNFISSLAYCENLPSLKRLILKQLFTFQQQQSLQKKAVTTHGPIQIMWISNHKLNQHQNWMHNFYLQKQQYGQTFRFTADPTCPHIVDYETVQRQIVKISSNFTTINSSSPIPKEGKQSLKFKILQPSQHFYVGVSNAFLKHQANIYSQHFVGLTFWGTIYSRGNSIPVTCKLKYQDKPIVRMNIDFESKMISWFFDEQIVGSVPFPQQFKYSQIYFLFGMRDVGTSIEIIEQ